MNNKFTKSKQYHKQRKVVTTLNCSDSAAYNGLLKSALTSLDLKSAPALLGHLRARNYAALLDWSERPITEYDGATSYYVEAQVKALIRKYPFTSAEVPGINPEKTALRKFLAAEHRCKWQNRRRRAYRKRYDPYSPYWDRARRYIFRVLGEKPDYKEIYESCDFTGGASCGVHGNKTNIARKILANTWSVTPTALMYAIPSLWSNIHTRDCILPGAIKCYDYESFSDIVVERASKQRYNKITFVPKTARTHRSIAVEPLLNGWLQKGVDVHMRKLLLRVGINLSNQETNRRKAREGSLGGFNSYATIDLKAASDTLSIETVRDLLPPEWFRFLLDLRSPSYSLDNGDTCVSYEKFCSMGNGFCFPLETLIFASVAYAVSTESSLTNPYDFSVYGDDVIVRQSAALLFTEVIQQFGFTTNKDKSFFVGSFRESCGADWIAGQDVRPVHVAKRLNDVREVMALHNSCYRSEICETALSELQAYLRLLVKKPLMRPGREPGDTCFSVPLDIAISCPRVRWDTLSQTWSWVELKSQPVKDSGLRDAGALPYALWLALMRGSSSQMLLVLRYTTKPVLRRIVRPYWDHYHGNVESLAVGRYDEWVSYPLSIKARDTRDVVLST